MSEQPVLSGQCGSQDPRPETFLVRALCRAGPRKLVSVGGRCRVHGTDSMGGSREARPFQDCFDENFRLGPFILKSSSWL